MTDNMVIWGKKTPVRSNDHRVVALKLKLKTNLYSTIKSEDSEALDGGTSWLSS